ncbi:glycerol dehydratase reactivase beta/small subunit family protein [Halococcus sp. AFM35]|jgi:hypothetical protein|uniref:glycerol dehydratase reactivase beta/small subunit family protein n=1 Tax=Halococcus sp. AFM35 TaxID=3421653 RepID=UPI003EBCFB27
MSGCRGPIETDDEIPRIHVWCLGDREPESVAFVERGIEEEGVSWVVGSEFEGNAAVVAHEAAIASSLGIGVCVAPDPRIVVHDERLPDNDPIFDAFDTSPECARRLGSNAARLAKGTSLKPISV